MKIVWTSEQLALLNKIKFDFDVSAEISDDQFLLIDHKVSDYFAMHGIGEDDEVNPTGRLCESIMDVLSEL